MVAGAALATAALIASGVPASDVLAVVGDHRRVLDTHWLLQIVVVAVGEELGWRGWLLPELAARTTRINAALATGAIWALLHGPLLLGSPLAVAAFVAGVFGLSVLFAWICWRAARSLFPVVVAHASVNAPFFFWQQVAGGPNAMVLARSWMIAEVSYALAAVALLMVAWQWWIRPERRATRPAAPAPDQ
jgi:membrane protease YdiL (CAAX protease family)